MGVHAAKLLSKQLYGESSSTNMYIASLWQWKKCTLNSSAEGEEIVSSYMKV